MTIRIILEAKSSSCLRFRERFGKARNKRPKRMQKVISAIGTALKVDHRSGVFTLVDPRRTAAVDKADVGIERAVVEPLPVNDDIAGKPLTGDSVKVYHIDLSIKIPD